MQPRPQSKDLINQRNKLRSPARTQEIIQKKKDERERAQGIATCADLINTMPKDLKKLSRSELEKLATGCGLDSSSYRTKDALVGAIRRKAIALESGSDYGRAVVDTFLTTISRSKGHEAPREIMSRIREDSYVSASQRERAIKRGEKQGIKSAKHNLTVVSHQHGHQMPKDIMTIIEGYLGDSRERSKSPRRRR